MRPVAPIMLLFFLTLGIIVPGAMATNLGLEAGKHAPSVQLPDLTGKTISLADAKGKVVLLNFWSSRCAPCVAELPSLNRLYAELKDAGLQVLAVSIDASDALVFEIVRAKNITFPVLRDAEREVYFDQYAGPSLPATYLIDKNGVIREIFTGPQEWDASAMKSKILKVLQTP